MQGFRNALHAPAFAMLAVTLFLILRPRAGARIAFAGAIIGSVLTAVSGEILQILAAGDASVVDLARDAMGISGVLLLIASADKQLGFGRGHFSRVLLLVGGLTLCGATVSPALTYAYAFSARANALPELISFEHGWEKVFYHGYGGAAVTRIPLETDNDLVAVVAMGRAEYSGLAIEPFPDWRGYTAFRFTASTVGRKNRQVTLRINDTDHNQQYADRFNRVLEIDDTPTEITIPLSEISALANGRQMQLDSVRTMVFFMIDTDGSEKIILNNIQLE